MASALRQGLEESNHKVTLARDGIEGLAAARTSDFDAVILDVMMPRMDGLDVVRRLRAERNNTPILLLTARDAATDMVRGLDAGADDYLTKPFSFQVLQARLRAISRRASRPSVSTLQVDDLILDPASRQVVRAGREISLTATEFRLLEFLIRRAGRAHSRSAVIEGVWGFDEEVESNTVDVYIKLLRDKTEAYGGRRLIFTVRGYGYIVREEES